MSGYYTIINKIVSSNNVLTYEIPYTLTINQSYISSFSFPIDSSDFLIKNVEISNSQNDNKIIIEQLNKQTFTLSGHFIFIAITSTITLSCKFTLYTPIIHTIETIHNKSSVTIISKNTTNIIKII